MYAKNIVESIVLKVELPMRLEIDNMGTVDIAPKCSSGGKTKHMEIRMLWLSELQEKGILDVKWIRGDDNETDIQTKNVSGPLFNKHCEVYCGKDKYGASG